jgi:hypothetical protein
MSKTPSITIWSLSDVTACISSMIAALLKMQVGLLDEHKCKLRIVVVLSLSSERGRTCPMRVNKGLALCSHAKKDLESFVLVYLLPLCLEG